MKLYFKTTIAFITCTFLLAAGYTFAQNQNLETPRPSPNATITQTVGVTHISIDYSSPGVKNRTIW